MNPFNRRLRAIILSVLAALLPLQPAMLQAAEPAQDQQELITQILGQMQSMGMTEGDTTAKAALGIERAQQIKNSVMDEAAYRELQMTALAAKLDKTATRVGSVVFKDSFRPTTDMALIYQRQELLKVLRDNEAIYKNLQKELGTIKKSEQAVLAYWEGNNALFAQVDQFYFSMLKWLFGEKINTNRWALETGLIWQMGSAFWNIILYLGLQQVSTNLFEAYVGAAKLDPWGSFKEGLKIYKIIDPRKDVSKNFATMDKETDAGKRSLRHQALSHGTWRDQVEAIACGFDTETTVPVPFGNKLEQARSNIKPGSIADKITPAFKNGEYLWRSEANNNSSPARKVWNYSQGVLGATAISGFKAYLMYESISASLSKLKNIIQLTNKLHVHTIHVARVIRTAQKLAATLAENPVLAQSPMGQKVTQFFANPSPEMKKLIDLLQSNTFDTSKAKSPIFARGNVLLAHRLMTRVHEELAPLLNGIAEVDSFVSMAANMKERAGTDLSLSFAEFTGDSQAMVDLKGAWLPLVHNPVANDILFGAGKPNKVVLTGPNGGGKSVYLKTLGAAIGMIQSWGIAPAVSARVSIFDGVRTSIHPEESLQEELSTFMAEKMRVDDIKEFVFGNNNPTFKVMLLLDEPFRGTVDAESAERIYQFGKDLAPLQQSIVIIATHVEKPTRLAQDTQNAFVNYHVCITEREDGTFERQFKLEPGLLRWWFDDAPKRSKFIDFVTHERHKDQIAKIKAAKKLREQN